MSLWQASQGQFFFFNYFVSSLRSCGQEIKLRSPIRMTNSKGSPSGSALISGGVAPPETLVHLVGVLGGREEQLWRRNFLKSISYRILDPEHSDDFSLNHFKTSSCPFKLDFMEQPPCVLLFTRVVVSRETNALEYLPYFIFSESRL